jgi:hypothetical protein
MSGQPANGKSSGFHGLSSATTPVSIGSEATAVTPLSSKPGFELIDATELGRRLSLPVSGIRCHSRRRTHDEIPTCRFGKYCRYRWNSPELEAWLADHQEGR